MGSLARAITMALAAFALAAVGLVASATPTAALTCGEIGATPGVIESVLDGTHTRADRWQVIAAGTITSIDPLNGDYASRGASVEMDVAYWFRGGDSERTLVFFDPPAGISGVGFEIGASYLVLASDDFNWDGRLATGLCELTYRLPDFERMKQLAAAFGGHMPDTAMPARGTMPWRSMGGLLLLFAGISGAAKIRLMISRSG